MSASVDELKQECLDVMTEVFKEYQEKVERAGGDPIDFEMIILEQWRPW